MAKKKPDVESVSEIIEVTQGEFECCLLGTSPLILNRMAEKAKHELLFPKGRKTAVERATSLKHDPEAEYRASAHRIQDPNAPTLLAILATSFKGAIRSAALDIPGAKKAQIGRLTFVTGEYIPIYGIPKLFMSVVRSADMNRTPDIRTRAILPEWACRVTIRYVKPLINAQAVANLLAAAGITIGVGDWRPEKGSGSFGQYMIVGEDDPRFVRITSAGARSAQQSAVDIPEAYDSESAELLDWYVSEFARRQLRGSTQTRPDRAEHVSAQ